jgi:HPt (histidine-containing phosphotransfer) domain-containing protein
MQPLDEHALQQLRQLNTGDGKGSLLNLLIEVYNAESPKLMDQMTSAYRAGNLKEVEISAHTLKSSSAQMGALEFSETCKSIEMIGRSTSNSSDGLSELVTAAENQLQQVMQMLLTHRV